MNSESFFDQIARTLAEPMPRRRAVRVLGASLLAVAVPGVSPRIARAATGGGSDVGPTVCPGRQLCSTYIDPNNWPAGNKHKCCPFPRQQWRCGPDGWTCTDTCAASGKLLGKKTKATWSAETMGGSDPTLSAVPKRYACCILPDHRPVDGECLPNCPYLYNHGGAIGPISCGKQCCAKGYECVTWLSSNAGNPPKKGCFRACKQGERRCPPKPGSIPGCCANACCDGVCCKDGDECRLWVHNNGTALKVCRPKCKAPEKPCDYDCCVDEKRFYRKNAKGKLMCRCRP